MYIKTKFIYKYFNNFQICYEFNTDVYSRLQAAYSQLGKRRIAMDQLHMHYTSVIHSSAFNVVHQHVLQENLQKSKKPYIQLCQAWKFFLNLFIVFLIRI